MTGVEGEIDLNLKGKRVTVMGLGLFGGGVGATRFLVKRGAEVTVTDLRDREALRESVDALAGLPVRLKLGGHDRRDFQEAELIVVNPAVPRDSPFLKIAQENGVPIDTEMNLFFRLCRAPIIGITGTNGKTTTTALVGDILRRVNPQTVVGGNIGGSLLDQIDQIQPDTPVVVELSSFQLEYLRNTGISPHIAVVTNLTANHLDRHRTMENYIEAKKGIIAHQGSGDTAVLNYDDSIVRGWEEECRGEVWFFSLRERLDQGVFVQGEGIVLNQGDHETEICGVGQLLLPGRHNLQNALASATAAWLAGAPPEAIRETFQSFQGVEHRLEFVRELGGVKYYNDSIATTPESTLAALDCFPEEITLIAGGSDKGLQFEELAEAIAARVKILILIGTTAEKIGSLVEREKDRLESKVILHYCSSLAQAVLKAQKETAKGGVVLLSPACASYDMFRNFKERGEMFKKLVWEL